MKKDQPKKIKSMPSNNFFWALPFLVCGILSSPKLSANQENIFRSCSMDPYVKEDALRVASENQNYKLHTLHKNQNEVGYVLTYSEGENTLAYYLWICSGFSKYQFSIENEASTLKNWIPSSEDQKITLSRSLRDDEALGKMHVTLVSRSPEATSLNLELIAASLETRGEYFWDSAMISIPNELIK